MTKFIKCKSLFNRGACPVKVKVIRAPLVDSSILKDFIQQRQRALVL